MEKLALLVDGIALSEDRYRRGDFWEQEVLERVQIANKGFC
jgi:hypothetical protein